MTDWTTARVTPEMLAELRRLLDAPPQHITIARDDALALLDAAAERDALAAAVERVRVLATEWATQPTDYDEDTEQQIEDGNAILRALDGPDA